MGLQSAEDFSGVGKSASEVAHSCGKMLQAIDREISFIPYGLHRPLECSDDMATGSPQSE